MRRSKVSPCSSTNARSRASGSSPCARPARPAQRPAAGRRRVVSIESVVMVGPPCHWTARGGRAPLRGCPEAAPPDGASRRGPTEGFSALGPWLERGGQPVPGGDPELPVCPRQVHLHRAHRDEERLGDL